MDGEALVNGIRLYRLLVLSFEHTRTYEMSSKTWNALSKAYSPLMERYIHYQLPPAETLAILRYAWETSRILGVPNLAVGLIYGEALGELGNAEEMRRTLWDVSDGGSNNARVLYLLANLENSVDEDRARIERKLGSIGQTSRSTWNVAYSSHALAVLSDSPQERIRLLRDAVDAYLRHGKGRPDEPDSARWEEERVAGDLAVARRQLRHLQTNEGASVSDD